MQTPPAPPAHVALDMMRSRISIKNASPPLSLSLSFIVPLFHPPPPPPFLPAASKQDGKRGTEICEPFQPPLQPLAKSPPTHLTCSPHSHFLYSSTSCFLFFSTPCLLDRLRRRAVYHCHKFFNKRTFLSHSSLLILLSFISISLSPSHLFPLFHSIFWRSTLFIFYIPTYPKYFIWKPHSSAKFHTKEVVLPSVFAPHF